MRTSREQILADLCKQRENVRSWRTELARKDTPLGRQRLAGCQAEIDRLLDQLISLKTTGLSHIRT